jgi:membrane-associated HD superfamily phosphohydrolase
MQWKPLHEVLMKYTEESISELVERIVCLQEQDGQFSDIPLTFKDISDIKSAFKKTTFKYLSYPCSVSGKRFFH